MIKCSSCGYPFDKAALKEIGPGFYCRVCIGVQAPKVNENPNAFPEAKFLVPIIAWCTNYLMAAIATRAEAAESANTIAPAGKKAFVVLSAEGQMVELQGEDGKPIELNGQLSKVDGTDFKKFPVTLPLR